MSEDLATLMAAHISRKLTSGVTPTLEAEGIGEIKHVGEPYEMPVILIMAGDPSVCYVVEVHTVKIGSA